MTDQFAFRDLTEEDYPFFYRSWLYSHARESPLTCNMEQNACFNGERRKIDAALKEGETLVACLPEMPSVVVGFLSCDRNYPRPIVHYVYVKEAFRKMGVATAMFKHMMLSPNDCVISHWSYLICQLKSKWPGMAFDYYLF